MDHTRELIKLVKGEFPAFEVYSGFDDNFAHNVLAGGDGCIAGLSNLVPGLCHAWTEAFAREDLVEAAAIQQKIDLLMEIYQVGTPLFPILKKRWQSKELSAAPPLPLSRKRIRGIRKNTRDS